MDTDPGQHASSESAAIGLPNSGVSAHRYPGDVVVAGKRDVDLYVRTYTTLLQSSGAIKVSSLESAHIAAGSALHAGATEPMPDLNAFIYSAQRLPAVFPDVSQVIMGQTEREFTRVGIPISAWEIVASPARRRRWHYDGEARTAVYVASESDLDDIIPTVVAYQIEWNKMHGLLSAAPVVTEALLLADPGQPLPQELATAVRTAILVSDADWGRLMSAWGSRAVRNLQLVAAKKSKRTLQVLGGSHLGYSRITFQWYSPAMTVLSQLGLDQRPVHFISSNTHSMVNVLTGTARRRKEAITAHILAHGAPELKEEVAELENLPDDSRWENLLYFAARSYFAHPDHASERLARAQEEAAVGIHHISPSGPFDVAIQIIDPRKLDPSLFDARLIDVHGMCLDPRSSDAVIINVDYPLGLAAYNIMTQIGIHTDQLVGIYILGKAATLNGRIGDVMISNVVVDEHSGNTYWFDNCFSYDDLAPLVVYGSVLDNQKAVTVKGTFLQNQGYLDFFYRENYTVVEMEAGPYLSALYEDVFPRRYPSGEAIRIDRQLPAGVDLGIIHYASDTPLSRSHTLGASGMSYYGMDSTYASTIAIMRRIFGRLQVGGHQGI